MNNDIEHATDIKKIDKVILDELNEQVSENLIEVVNILDDIGYLYEEYQNSVSESEFIDKTSKKINSYGINNKTYVELAKYIEKRYNDIRNLDDLLILEKELSALHKATLDVLKQVDDKTREILSKQNKKIPNAVNKSSIIQGALISASAAILNKERLMKLALSTMSGSVGSAFFLYTSSRGIVRSMKGLKKMVNIMSKTNNIPDTRKSLMLIARTYKLLKNIESHTKKNEKPNIGEYKNMVNIDNNYEFKKSRV